VRAALAVRAAQVKLWIIAGRLASSVRILLGKQQALTPLPSVIHFGLVFMESSNVTRLEKGKRKDEKDSE
jgi:hypothetical protein